jgi:predicted dehydrogenase
MTAVRVAVVGLGAIGFEHLGKLSTRPDVEIVGVCDLSATLTRAVAERFDAGRPYTDLGRMLEAERPAVVHVLTPPASHAPVALAALAAGAHVFVEKPIAPTWEAYVGIRDAAHESGLLLCEDYNMRFMPAALAARRAWESGILGELVCVDVAYCGLMPAAGAYADRDLSHFAHDLPGGALQNFVTHPVSLALPFLGGCHQVTAVRRRADPRSLSDDELRAILTGRQASATVTLSGRGAPPQLTLTLRGTNGSLEADLMTGRVHVSTAASAVLATLRRGLAELAACTALVGRRVGGCTDVYAGLGTLLDGFYGAVAGSRPSPVSPREIDDVNAAIRDVFACGVSA